VKATSRCHLFVAIDRATRRVIMQIYGRMMDKSSVDFLRRFKLASPTKTAKSLTNNSSRFTDRFANKDKKPSGKYAAYVARAAPPAEHRPAPPRHPQTNGVEERFSGRINKGSAGDALRQQGRPGNDFAELFEAVQPPYSATSHRQKDTDFGVQGMAEEALRTIR
jgi:hypothetical protein